MEEIPQAERCVESPPWAESEESGRNKVNVSASTHYQPKGVRESRAAHITAKAMHSTLNRIVWWDSPGYGRRHALKERYETGEALPGSLRQAKTAGIRQESKARGVGRESEGFIVPVKSRKRDGGKGPCIGRA